MTEHTHDFGPDQWPFSVSSTSRVITTVPVLEQGAPVLLVSHDDDDDGGWQLLCGTTNRQEDGRAACFGCMVEKDPSLRALADLPAGWQARREDASSPWERRKPKSVHEIIQETIATEGFQIILQPPERPIWAYTLGLGLSVSMPDLVIIGLPPQVMHQMLLTLATMAAGGEKLEHGYRTDALLHNGLICELRSVDPAWLDVLLMHAGSIYEDRPFSALQITWPDKQNKLPHEEGFDEALRRRQPQLEIGDAEKAGMVPLLRALGRM